MKSKPQALLQAVERLLDTQSTQEIMSRLDRIHTLNRQLPLPQRERCQQEALQMVRRKLQELSPDAKGSREILLEMCKGTAPIALGSSGVLSERPPAISLFLELMFADSRGLALSEISYSEECGFWLAEPCSLAEMRDSSECRKALDLHRAAIRSATPAEAAEDGRQFRRALLRQLLRWAEEEQLGNKYTEMAALLETLGERVREPPTPRCASSQQEPLYRIMNNLFTVNDLVGNVDSSGEKYREQRSLLGNCPTLQICLEEYSEFIYVIQFYQEIENAGVILPVDEERLLRLYVVLFLTDGAISDDWAYAWAMGGDAV